MSPSALPPHTLLPSSVFSPHTLFPTSSFLLTSQPSLLTSFLHLPVLSMDDNICARSAATPGHTSGLGGIHSCAWAWPDGVAGTVASRSWGGVCSLAEQPAVCAAATGAAAVAAVGIQSGGCPQIGLLAPGGHIALGDVIRPLCHLLGPLSSQCECGIMSDHLGDTGMDVS